MRLEDQQRARLLTAIFVDGPRDLHEFVVLAALASLCDVQTRSCSTSLGLLSDRARLSVASTRRATRQLAAGGWIATHREGAAAVTQYKVLRPAPTEGAHQQPSRVPTSNPQGCPPATLKGAHQQPSQRPSRVPTSNPMGVPTGNGSSIDHAVARTDENQNEVGMFGNAARPSHRARVQRRGERAVSLRDLSLDQDLNKREEEEEERRERGVWGEGEDQPTPRFDPCPEPSSRPCSQPSPALGLPDQPEALEPSPSAACADSIAALGTGSETAAGSAGKPDGDVAAGADGAAEAGDGVADQGPDRSHHAPPRPVGGPGAGRRMAVAVAVAGLPGVFGDGTAPTMGDESKAAQSGGYAAGNGGEPANGFALVVQDGGGDKAGVGGAPSALELAALTAYERAIVQAILDDERAAARIRAVSPRGKRVPSLPEICRAGSLPALAVQLVELAPAVDVVRAVASAGAWLRERGQARKSGNLFLQNWMRRAQGDAEMAAQREGRACVPFEYRAPPGAGHARSSAGELGAPGAQVYAGPSAVMLPEERLDPWFRKWREEQRQKGQEPAGTREEAIAATRAMIEAKDRPLRESGYYEVEERRARVARGEVTWAQLAQEWADQQRQKAGATTGAGEKGVDA